MIGLVGIALTFSSLLLLLLRELVIAAREAAEARKPQPLYVVRDASNEDIVVAWKVTQAAVRHEVGAQG